MKKDWQKLTYHQQKTYKDKAEYLLERGYVSGKSVEDLAKQMYEQSG